MFQKIYAFDRILSQNMFIAVRTSCRKKGYSGALVFELSFLLLGRLLVDIKLSSLIVFHIFHKLSDP